MPGLSYNPDQLFFIASAQVRTTHACGDPLPGHCIPCCSHGVRLLHCRSSCSCFKMSTLRVPSGIGLLSCCNGWTPFPCSVPGFLYSYYLILIPLTSIPPPIPIPFLFTFAFSPIPIRALPPIPIPALLFCHSSFLPFLLFPFLPSYSLSCILSYSLLSCLCFLSYSAILLFCYSSFPSHSVFLLFPAGHWACSPIAQLLQLPSSVLRTPI